MLLSVSTHSLLAQSIVMLVAVSKIGVVLHRAWSESQWTVLVGYLTILVNVSFCQIRCAWQLCSPATQHTKQCMQHSSTVAVQKSQFHFSWSMTSTAENWTPLITRFRGTFSSVSMKCDWNKRLKKSNRNCLNSGKAVIQQWRENMQFSCFHVFQVTQLALVTLGGKINVPLIAYHISNISAKSCQTPLVFVEVIASQRYDILFLRRGMWYDAHLLLVVGTEWPVRNY